MALTLHALSLNEQPLSQPLVAHFDDHGGSIGRADHNTLALPDPERVISRIQAEISLEAPASYLITNVSRANPIVVAGRQLVHGESSPLCDRDVIRIGGYLIETSIEAHAALAPEEAAQPVVRAASSAPLPAAPVAPASWQLDDPFADLLPPAASSSGQFNPAGPAPPAPVTPAAALPRHFDPFAAQPPATATAAPALDVFAELNAAQSNSIDNLFGLSPTGADPLDDFLAERPGAAPSVTPRAPAKALATPPPTPHPATPAPRPQPKAEAQWQPLPPSEDRPLPRPASQPQPAAVRQPAALPVISAPSPQSTDPLWAAFCDAAGVHVDLPQGLTPELMRVLGHLLRSAVDGTQQLMSIRTAAKYELRANVTMIHARNNNPLKFTPDGTAALEQLLQPPMRGFLSGPAAMTDAMNDLVGHSIGTMAGMRAALDGVLDRFTPAELQHQLGTSSVLDSLLPMSRKAKLWELYLQHFQSIRTEAQEDFHTLFGKAFLAAYEQQLERLRAQQTPPPPMAEH
jgi:FHA domain-containing protein